MKLSKHAKQNLRADKRVQGKRWGKTYGGFWHNPANAQAFVRATNRYLRALPDEPAVLEVGSADGFLAETVASHLRKLGKHPHVTISDMSAKHLAANPNPRTRKIQADLLTLNLTRTAGRFDVILMRSVLHYFPTLALQTRVLRRLRRHLAPGGVLLLQDSVFERQREADLLTRIFQTKLAPWRFNSTREIQTVTRHAGLRATRVGFAPDIHVTHDDHARRYALTPADTRHIRALIQAVPATDRPHHHLTKNGYTASAASAIYACRAPSTRTT
ncbi:Methyltransferase domain protein [uncultured archaeon]|nr:Methyltransferase domain protein [uncultured archaeon]